MPKKHKGGTCAPPSQNVDSISSTPAGSDQLVRPSSSAATDMPPSLDLINAPTAFDDMHQSVSHGSMGDFKPPVNISGGKKKSPLPAKTPAVPSRLQGVPMHMLGNMSARKMNRMMQKKGDMNKEIEKLWNDINKVKEASNRQ